MRFYPLKFTPLLAHRIWGGQTLAQFGKTIPPGQLIGESWEISDRDEAQSVVANGPLAGRTLRQLMAEAGPELLGTNTPAHANVPSRFPLLIKLLDARDRLSLQVHPPATIAPQLGGEPKTEMWYVMDADPDAHLIAGLKRGTTRAQFEEALRGSNLPTATGSQLESMLHRFPVNAGDTLFVPSGRLHAIDAGLVIAEIQQNSDTTYRVYDGGRVGLDGKPRALHVTESLACIDFNDFEPPKVQPAVERHGGNGLWRLVECEHFHVHKLEIVETWDERTDGTTFHVLGCVHGKAGVVTPNGWEGELQCGEWLLLPANLGYYSITPTTPLAKLLKSFVPA